MADLTAPPNLPASQDELSTVIREAVAHIYSSPNPVAFHDTIPVETITPAHPPQGVDHRHGGYFQLEYVGGGTAQAYGDHITLFAGGRVNSRRRLGATLALSPMIERTAQAVIERRAAHA